MIIELVTSPMFLLIDSIIALIPEGLVLPNYISQTLDLLKYPLSIFPVDLWVVIISNVTFWYGAQMSWAIIEWVYKKIPMIS